MSAGGALFGLAAPRCSPTPEPEAYEATSTAPVVEYFTYVLSSKAVMILSDW